MPESNKLLRNILIISLLALGFYLIYQKEDTVQPAPSSNEEIAQKWLEQTSELPPVLVKVVPTELAGDADWKFQLTYTTHSEELSQNQLEAVSLVDDAGNVYRPIAWEGPEPGGHHIEGLIVFKNIQPLPKYIEIKIKDVGGIAERSFRWDLK